MLLLACKIVELTEGPPDGGPYSFTLLSSGGR